MSWDLLLYIGVAIALYVAADWVVGLVERRLGRRFANRQLLFLVVLLVLLVVGLKLLGLPAMTAFG
jgi:predicted PurR-regulated permease PerM